MPAADKPVIVLVHGAFADASGWSDVFHSLTDQGYTVYAPANPLRGVAADGDYLRDFVSTLGGRPVVLVGHSYGGCVITNGGTGAASGPSGFGWMIDGSILRARGVRPTESAVSGRAWWPAPRPASGCRDRASRARSTRSS